MFYKKGYYDTINSILNIPFDQTIEEKKIEWWKLKL